MKNLNDNERTLYFFLIEDFKNQQKHSFVDYLDYLCNHRSNILLAKIEKEKNEILNEAFTFVEKWLKDNKTHLLDFSKLLLPFPCVRHRHSWRGGLQDRDVLIFNKFKNG